MENVTQPGVDTSTDTVEDTDGSGQSYPRQGPNRTAIIAGSVAGAVVALLAIGAAIILTRRCLVGHRTRPDPGFEVDEGDHTSEIAPFLGGFVSRVRHSTRVSSKNIGQPAIIQPAAANSNPPSQDLVLSDAAGPAFALPTAPEARVVHDQDAEDAALEVLPPMYSEAWARHRTSMALQHGASSVTGAGQESRAEEKGNLGR